MAKSSAKAARGSGRRRTAARAGRGLRLPWLPIIVVAGIAGVVGLVAFLFLQARSSSGSDEAAIAAEADASPALPGEFVDLPEIYGGPYSETGGHVRRAIDYAAEGNSNPPAGGPHWSGNCGDDPSAAPAFCGPAPWGVFREEWDAATLVHNMEHGGVVLWYNTTDQDLIGELEALVTKRLEDGELLVMAPYPEMEEGHIALTSWSRIDKFPVADYSPERVETFIDTHLRRFNPEDF
ncbi:MAG: DUF3105 domain-containing protein [Dehalococcoidia bacterium]|nr:DUF3105 domain-containing protein [Dehalococcoidia bacterium]